MESVEELFGSKGRIRVLRVLSENGELHISHIARSTGMNHNHAERHLEKLKDMGMLREKRYGPIRIFEVTFNSLTVRFEKGLGVKVERVGHEDCPKVFT